NLVVLDTTWSDEFRGFCERNPQPCPLLDVTAPGSPIPRRLAPEADLRTDLSGYRIYQGATFAEVSDLLGVWGDNDVGFLLGCSFTFERALRNEGIPLRHVELGRIVPMYRTTIQCEPSGRLAGPMVVSMRPIPRSKIDRVTEICRGYPASHGAPVHVGDPSAIGIVDLDRPDYGDPVPLGSDELPVFWGCGVTPQVVLEQSGCERFSSHKPGSMFVSDRSEELTTL